ncbi:hypothetical protein [Pseudonocardia sp.]|uniref:hypothetical protein n=1 Tax=Pseudonocardia sp. TaxID=60912 RepID=UPI003D0C1E10
MIEEARVFLLADAAAVGVFTRITDWTVVLPPVFDMPGADRPRPLRQAVDHLAYDDAWVPAMLAGATMDDVGRTRFDGDLLGEDRAAGLVRIGEAARAAAATVTDPDAVVHCSFGDCTTADYLWQLNIARTLSAYDVATLIGAPCPLGEDLARGMFAGTAPTARTWREFGIYRTPAAVPPGAPWRDRYLALTGREPLRT